MANPQRERAFADVLFKRLAITPLNVDQDERPDFRFDHDSKRIGMEITESTPHEHYWAQELVKKLGGNPPARSSSRPHTFGTTDAPGPRRRFTKTCSTILSSST